MRNTLFATSALAFAAVFAAGSVLAADAKKEDEAVEKAEATEMAEAPKEEMAEEVMEEAPPPKLALTIGGYMEQWVGMADVDASGVDGGIAQNSDSEIHFRGALEADNGLTFSVKVELEGNSSGSQIDESQFTVGGAFGQIVLGSEDEAQSLMHYGHKDAGIGLNAGDTGLWLGSSASFGLNTTGWHGDAQMVSYYTPRIAGAQFGASYIPDTGSEDKNMAPTHNDKSAYSMGVNYQSNLGEASVAVSAGYYQAGQTMDAVDLMSGMNDDRINVGAYTANKKAIAAYGKAVAEGTAGSLDALATGAASAAADNKDAVTSMGSKADDKTFTNFGIQVGMGAFGFNVAYAENEGGAYKVMDMPIQHVEPGHTWDHDGDDGTANATAHVAESASNNDPDNDWARTVLVEDTSKDYDVVSVGAIYSDGPMAVSIGWIASDYGNGDESSATMLSVGYTLAPGVSSKTSIFQAEGTKGGSTVEGTGFVTGIAIGF